MDMHGQNNMTFGLVETLLAASGKKVSGRNLIHLSLYATAPLPCITGKQTLLLYLCR
jgi:hypothetical protein